MKKSPKIIFIIACVVVLGLGLWLWLRTTTPPTQTPTTPIVPITTENLQKYAITTNPTTQTSILPKITLPKTIPIYSYEKLSFTNDQFLQLATQFNFPTPEVTSNYIKSKNNNGLFFINLTTQTTTIILPHPIPNNPNEQTLVTDAHQTIKPLLPPNPEWANPKYTIDYHQTEPEPGHPQNPTTTVHIFPTIDGVRIIGNDRYPLGETGLAKVTYYQNTNQTSLNTAPIKVDFNQKTIQPLRQLDDISSAVATNQTTIISLEQELPSEAYQDAAPIPQAAEFTSIELVYLYDPEIGNTLQPFFLLTGTATIEGGELIKIKSLLPALKNN